MTTHIERATIEDADQLLQLFFAIYKNNYPLPLCSDRSVMVAHLKNLDIYWYIVKSNENGAIIGSAIFETDAVHRIGKLLGVVVHPDYRKAGVANQLIAKGIADLLMPSGDLRSIYTTTRTHDSTHQKMCLSNHFIPLGIFPNAIKDEEHETLTLMAVFAGDILASKKAFPPITEKVAPILDIIAKYTPNIETRKFAPPENIAKNLLKMPQNLNFEIIDAPAYVMRRFQEEFSDPNDRYFPFHSPNLLLSSTNGEVEIFAFIDREKGHLSIVALSKPIAQLRHRIRPLLFQLRNIGVSYIEILVGLNLSTSINVLCEAQFLPSAIYPAMYEVDGHLADFVVMTRTLDPLNFSHLKLEEPFKPFINLYIKQWKELHMNTLNVFESMNDLV